MHYEKYVCLSTLNIQHICVDFDMKCNQKRKEKKKRRKINALIKTNRFIHTNFLVCASSERAKYQFAFNYMHMYGLWADSKMHFMAIKMNIKRRNQNKRDEKRKRINAIA